ncbi:hypothetical protein VTO42DRAFT_6116 [Malbranchea cinnamomea]
MWSSAGGRGAAYVSIIGRGCEKSRQARGERERERVEAEERKREKRRASDRSLFPQSQRDVRPCSSPSSISVAGRLLRLRRTTAGERSQPAKTRFTRVNQIATHYPRLIATSLSVSDLDSLGYCITEYGHLISNKVHLIRSLVRLDFFYSARRLSS